MREKSYRISRLCRTLGNPVTYRIVETLADGGKYAPSELARLTKRALPTVSNLLRLLKLSDLVRFEGMGNRTRYWLKYPGMTRELIGVLSRHVDRTGGHRR